MTNLPPLNTVKAIVSAALGGQHALVEKHARALSISLKGEAEASADMPSATALIEFAQWIDGQLAHLSHQRRGSAATVRVHRAAEHAARTDAINNLLKRRVINGAELRAARRLESLFEEMAIGIGVKARDYGASRVDSPGAFLHPIERIGAGVAHELVAVFWPWAKEMQRVDVGMVEARTKHKRPWWQLQWKEYLAVRMSGGTMDAPLPPELPPQAFLPWAEPLGPPVNGTTKPREIGRNCFELTRAILVDRRTVRSLESTWRARNGSLSRPLVFALQHFNHLWQAMYEEWDRP